MTAPIRVLLAAQAPPALVRLLEAAVAASPLALAGPRLTAAPALLRAAAGEAADAAVVAATLPGLDAALVTSLRQLGLGVVVVTWGAAEAPTGAAGSAGAVVVAGEALRQAPASLADAARAAVAAGDDPPPMAPASPTPDAGSVRETAAASAAPARDGASPPVTPAEPAAPSAARAEATEHAVRPPPSWRARRAASLGLPVGDDRPATASPLPATPTPDTPVTPPPPLALPAVTPAPVPAAAAAPAVPLADATGAWPAIGLPLAQLPLAAPPPAAIPRAAPDGAAALSPTVPAGPAAPRPVASERPALYRPDAAGPPPIGHLIALVSGPGGADGTTLLHGLGAALGPDPTLLVDLQPDGDAAGPALDLPATGAGVVGLVAAPAGRDPVVLRAALVREAKPVLPHLRAVLGLARLADAVYLTPPAVADLLGAARAAATWTLVDLGRWAGPRAPWQAAVIVSADLVLVATCPEPPALARLQAWLDEGVLAGRRDGVHLVITGARGDGRDDAGRVERALGLPVAAALPADPTAAAWLADHRAPITLAAGPLPDAIRALARAIRAGAALPEPAGTPAPAPARLGRAWRPDRLAGWLAAWRPTWRPRRPASPSGTTTTHQESHA